MTMYAEERQQAIARLVTQHGAGVGQPAGPRVRRDHRDRAPRPVHARARRRRSAACTAAPSPRAPCPSSRPASASATRSTRADQGRGSPAPRSTASRRRGGTILLDAGSTTGRSPALLPPDRELTVVTHARPDRRPAGRPAASLDLRLLPGRVRAPDAGGGRPDTVAALLARCASTSPSSAPTAITADHGLTTPDPDEAAVKRAMVARGQLRRASWPTPRSSASRPPSGSRPRPRSTSLVTDAGVSRRRPHVELADASRPRGRRIA